MAKQTSLRLQCVHLRSTVTCLEELIQSPDSFDEVTMVKKEFDGLCAGYQEACRVHLVEFLS